MVSCCNVLLRVSWEKSVADNSVKCVFVEMLRWLPLSVNMFRCALAWLWLAGTVRVETCRRWQMRAIVRTECNATDPPFEHTVAIR